MTNASTPTLRPIGAAFGVLAGVLIAWCAWLPVGGVAAVFVALALALAWGWPQLLDLPSPRGTSFVLALTGVALTFVMLLSPAGARSRWAGVVVCVGLIASFLHQLLRQDGRPRLVMSVAGTALGLGVLGAGSYLLPNTSADASRALMVSAGTAVAIGCLTDAVAGSSQLRIPVGLGQTILGAVVGTVALVAFDLPAWLAIAAGALSGFVGWACLRTTVTEATANHRRAQFAAGAACALVAAFVPFGLHNLA